MAPQATVVSIKDQGKGALTHEVDLEALFSASLVENNEWGRRDDKRKLGLGTVQLPKCDDKLLGLVPSINPHYIFDRDTLYEVLLYLTEPHHDALFMSGPTGCGKTSCVTEAAARLGWPLEAVTLSQRTEVGDLIGAQTLVNGTLRFCYGPLSRAMLYGEILLLNEVDLMNPGELSALNDVLEGRALTISANQGEVIKPHPFFRVVATANTKGMGDESGLYHGVRLQNQAFLDRWRFCEVGYPSEKQERLMLARACPELNPDFVDGILHLTKELRLSFDPGENGTNHDLLRRLEQAEYRLLSASIKDLKESAQSLRQLIAAAPAETAKAEDKQSMPKGALAASLNPAVSLNHVTPSSASLRSELIAAAICDLGQVEAATPFFDEVLAHKSMLLQFDPNLDDAEAQDAANELFWRCSDKMMSFEQMRQQTIAQKQLEQDCASLPVPSALSDEVGGAMLNELLGAKERSMTRDDCLSAPFSSRSLLRVARLYYEHEELSVQEALALGFASRLPPYEYEFVLRLSYDIFGYGSNFNSLPHRVTNRETYERCKDRVLKYSLSKLHEHLANLQRSQAQLMQAQAQAQATQAAKEAELAHNKEEERMAKEQAELAAAQDLLAQEKEALAPKRRTKSAAKIKVTTSKTRKVGRKKTERTQSATL